MDNGASSYHRFLDGDDDGIVEIIRDYKDGLILFLNRYVNNVHIAEDLAEDTFFRIVTRKPRFTQKFSFKTWLYTIGRNIALNYIKHAGKMLDTDMEDLERVSGDEDEIEQAYIRGEERIVVHRALSQIKPDYSRVLYLKYFEDMTNEQMAAVLKKSRRQIENLVYQSKRALRSELDKEGYGYEGLQRNGG